MNVNQLYINLNYILSYMRFLSTKTYNISFYCIAYYVVVYHHLKPPLRNMIGLACYLIT